MKKVSNQHMILEKTLSSDHWLGTMAQVVALGVLLSFATPTFAAGNKITKLDCTNGQIAKWNGTGWICDADIDTNTDTNATTECTSSDQLLDSDGDCIPIPVDTDTNAATICSDGEVLMGGTGDCQTLPEDLPALPDEPFEAVLKICGNSDTPQWGGACIYEIGDRGPGGGFVFDVTDGGLHGLEAAPEDQGIEDWGCWPSPISGADGTAVGTGAQNTADILAGCTETPIAASIAAGYSLNGHNDWFLPSQEELNLMYTNLHQAGLGGFDGYYWSSSEFDDYQARARGFNGGDHVTRSKFVTFIRVRAVRAF